MANNKASRKLNILVGLYDGWPNAQAEIAGLADLVDRLAVAAGDAVLLLSACDDAPSKSAAAALRTILREIELPQESSSES